MVSEYDRQLAVAAGRIKERNGKALALYGAFTQVMCLVAIAGTSGWTNGLWPLRAAEPHPNRPDCKLS